MEQKWIVEVLDFLQSVNTNGLKDWQCYMWAAMNRMMARNQIKGDSELRNSDDTKLNSISNT